MNLKKKREDTCVANAVGSLILILQPTLVEHISPQWNFENGWPMVGLYNLHC